MDYLLNLRQFVGHAPLQMVGAATLIVDADNRLLLLKRSDSGCWGPPGGALELGEFLEAAARREVREETGLELGELSFFGVFSGPDLFYRYPNGDEIYNVSIVYLCRDFSGTIEVDPGEGTEAAFFPADQLPEAISPPVRVILDDVVRRFEEIVGGKR